MIHSIHKERAKENLFRITNLLSLSHIEITTIKIVKSTLRTTPQEFEAQNYIFLVQRPFSLNRMCLRGIKSLKWWNKSH